MLFEHQTNSINQQPMNKSYLQWESQFLDDMVIKFGFSGNTAIAFKHRLLDCYSDCNDKDLAEEIKGYFRVRGEEPLQPEITLRDCWIKNIYKEVTKYGFNYDKSWEFVRKWLREEIFPEYIKNIKPETTIELWQELWETSEESNKISVQQSLTENNLPHLGIAMGDEWNPNPQKNYPSFPIGSKINYHFTLNNQGYLIVIEKFAHGEIYCLAPSKLNPNFPANWGRLILPENNVFTVAPPIGYEEILAILSQDKPQLNWLPQSQDNPLELQTKHLADLVNYVKENKCEVMQYKYLITS